jgi:hypothetical protein
VGPRPRDDEAVERDGEGAVDSLRAIGETGALGVAGRCVLPSPLTGADVGAWAPPTVETGGAGEAAVRADRRRDRNAGYEAPRRATPATHATPKRHPICGVRLGLDSAAAGTA